MGKLRIRVKPGANKNKIEKMSDGTFKIWIKEQPIKGRANKALIEYLKKTTNFKVSIISGETSNYKLIEFPVEEERFISILDNKI